MHEASTLETGTSPRGTESREQIFACALRLFARQGYDRTGMRELAREAGVNLAMVNYFFGSKQNLLREILDTFFSAYIAIARRELHSATTPQLRLRRFIRAAIAHFAEHQEHLIIAITDLHHDDEELSSYKARWAEQMLHLLEQQVCAPLRQHGKADISAKTLSPLLTSMMASRFLFAPVIQRADNASIVPDIDAYSDMIATVAVYGINAFTASTQEPL